MNVCVSKQSKAVLGLLDWRGFVGKSHQMVRMYQQTLFQFSKFRILKNTLRVKQNQKRNTCEMYTRTLVSIFLTSFIIIVSLYFQKIMKMYIQFLLVLRLRKERLLGYFFKAKINTLKIIFYMPSNNKQKEYIDIPIHIEDTPLHLFEKFTNYTLAKDSLELGFDFISRIDSALRSTDCQNQLLSLYFNYYENANSSMFSQKDWPACHQIQAKYEDKDFNAKVQSLYNQLRQRSRFDRIKSVEGDEWLEVAEQSWDNYESILQRECKQINFPPIVAWQIIQNFLCQFSKYHQLKNTLTDQSKVQEFVFDIKKTKKLLGGLAALIPSQHGKSTTSKQNFACFALLASAILQVYEENYQKALEILSKISLQSLSVYSRAIGSLFSLLLTASYAYFMLQQYKESARLAELALSFYQKNKKYFSGAIGERILTRQFQKLVGILCLNYIFLEERPKPLILQAFKSITIKIKDKQQKQKLSDKHTKLRQNDQGTFVKLFNFCSLPSIVKNSKINEKVLARFHQLQNLTLNSILHHYTQISLSKIAKMLKISESEVSKEIESFNNISTGCAAWDRTIMEPLLGQTHKIYVEVTDGLVKLDTDQTNVNEGYSEWQQYRQQIAWLVQKVNAL